MGLLRIKLTKSFVYASYMGGEPKISPMNDAWISILNSLILGEDIIQVSDERERKSTMIPDLSFTYNTDTAERKLPQDDEIIDPLHDPDALVDWLENNPDELNRLKRLMNNRDG